ncbi:uncharacterized protein LOC120188188 [Hibiscus syriacus]|uniref:uncharacterized protein LOC120188188 n=1 Tax=Hibiscus syriacus TaxID=106335 RepID=UPI0019238F3B|nr:uncharacterized protein LOC120188188 [Hibiscus syriacus]
MSVFLLLKTLRVGSGQVRRNLRYVRREADAVACKGLAVEALLVSLGFSSPPETWDLLYAAAGEVARMPVNEEAYGVFNNRGLLRSPATKLSQNFDVSGFYPHPQSLSHQKLHAAQFQILKQQQLMNQINAQKQYQQQPRHHHVVQNRVRSNNGTNRPMGLSPSAFPPLQQQKNRMANGSGMQAVYLNNATAKRECAGTGVFLPPRIGAPSEHRKKPACPTVLLPARVVQALNLNLNEIEAQPQLHPRFNANFTADTDAAMKKLQSGENVFANQKQRNFRQHQGINHEVGLPQEWTY